MLQAFAPGDIPRLHEAAINVPAALFTSAVLVVVTLLVGLAPALVALRMNAFEGAIPTGRSSDGRTTTRLRDALTVVEIALAASLLVCAGLTLRSLDALARVDLGFATEHRFAFKTNLTEHDCEGGSSRRTIGRALRLSRSWTTCSRGVCGRTKRRQSGGRSGLAPGHGRRREPSWAWCTVSTRIRQRQLRRPPAAIGRSRGRRSAARRGGQSCGRRSPGRGPARA